MAQKKETTTRHSTDQMNPSEDSEKKPALCSGSRLVREFMAWLCNSAQSGRLDSNQRPPHPQYGALPDCATSRTKNDGTLHESPQPASPVTPKHQDTKEGVELLLDLWAQEDYAPPRLWLRRKHR